MELQFKFKNDVTIKVDPANQNAVAYSYERHGETYDYFVEKYDSNEELIELMKRASNIINSEQHADIFDIIYEIYGGKEGCEIRIERNGLLNVIISSYSDSGIKDMMSAVSYYELENVFIQDFDSIGTGGFVYDGNKQIATIYKYKI